MEELTIGLPDELVEAIARRAADIAAERLQTEDRWLDTREAAEHIRAPRGRVYALVEAGRIPVHRDGSRLLFRRSELDKWLSNGGGRRP